jgi:hypothetical protein
LKIIGNNMNFSFLCELGIHKWKDAGGVSSFSSSVRKKYYRCTRFGKRMSKVTTK